MRLIDAKPVAENPCAVAIRYIPETDHRRHTTFVLAGSDIAAQQLITLLNHYAEGKPE